MWHIDSTCFQSGNFSLIGNYPYLWQPIRAEIRFVSQVTNLWITLSIANFVNVPSKIKYFNLLNLWVSIYWICVSVNSAIELIDYLQVLAQLTKNFSKMLTLPSQDDEDEDSDSEDNPADASEKAEITVQ